MSRALGRYELLRPIARGGMAEVYLARRRAAGIEKLLVIKRIRPERATDTSFLDLFVKEARLSMSLAHQNIVPVFDFGRVGDQVYLAMERVEGKDLGSSLVRAGDRPLPPLVAAFIAAECLQALDYAHRRERDGEHLGIVHRDVTPRNVLLSWSGEVKLTDFGIASLAGDASNRLLGTPAYMAPEQARREPVDARADLYAIGLMLREALTRERARPGEDREAQLAAARTGELRPWPEGMPPALVAVVDRATAIAAGDRHPDARAMLAELDEYIVGARAATRGEPPARQLATWLADVWAGALDESGEVPAVDDAFVSILEADAVGTGTERSMLATATDEAAAGPPPAAAPARRRSWLAVPAVLAAATLAVVAVTRDGDDRADDPERAALATPGSDPAPAGSATARPGPGSSSALGDAPATGSTGSATPTGSTGSGDEPDPDPAARGSTAPGDDPDRAARGSAAAGDDPDPAARGPAHPGEGSATAPAIAERDTNPRPRPARTGPARPNPGPAGARRGSARTVPEPDAGTAAAVVLRPVTINARPWAYFYVDDDPTQHQTLKRLALPPGRHRIRFANPVLGVERSITIEVPTEGELRHVEDLRR